ncbi:hypothetical protein KDX38_15020 [Pseudomonas sp. CDFA 602]|uniref:hypothetical protein n=1 Tax=Pseudomonas californiensis TaxID=2829823 RepID=UPI001E510CD1|nr:hypothetical protein [Pseudomonas californiensis]MCD5994850.1 hypothetical protein [Pseudomonas californiensis]MCD6000519.1 hypothetical protein [Pseudomonas californiensis]
MKRLNRMSAHYIQQQLTRQVGFVGYFGFVAFNFVTALMQGLKPHKTHTLPSSGALQTSVFVTTAQVSGGLWRIDAPERDNQQASSPVSDTS